MFGIIADFIASITTILLPAYLSYKALRTSDPAQLAPWLIYFVVLSLFLLAESWTLFIIGWVPFYSWLRLFFLSYLILPQTQGAKVMYLTYVEPFIVQHERDIDLFIGDAHERLEGLGLGYMNMLIDWVREKVLGQKSPEPAQASGMAAGVGGYAQNLLSRFTMPAARPNTFGMASDMYGMLSGVAGAAIGAGVGGGRSRGLAAEGGPAIPDSVIPESLANSSNAEKSSFITAQRERLNVLMRALDKEQQTLDLAYGASSGQRPESSGRDRGFDSNGSSGGLRVKSRSEQSFERVEHEEARSRSDSGHLRRPDAGQLRHPDAGRRTTSGNWIPTGWFGGSGGGSQAVGTPDDPDERETGTSRGWSAAVEVTEAIQGLSSTLDSRRR